MKNSIRFFLIWILLSTGILFAIGWTWFPVVAVALVASLYPALIHISSGRGTRYVWLVRLIYLPVWGALGFQLYMVFFVLTPLVGIMNPTSILRMAAIALAGAIAGAIIGVVISPRYRFLAILPVCAGLALLSWQTREIFYRYETANEARALLFDRRVTPVLIPGVAGEIPEEILSHATDPFRLMTIIDGKYLMVGLNSHEGPGGLLRFDLQRKVDGHYPLEALASCSLMDLKPAGPNRVVCAGYACKSLLVATAEPFRWEREIPIGQKHPQFLAWKDPGKSLLSLSEDTSLVEVNWSDEKTREPETILEHVFTFGSGCDLVPCANGSLWLMGSDIIPPVMAIFDRDFHLRKTFYFPHGRGIVCDETRNLAYFSDSVFGRILEVEPVSGKVLRKFKCGSGIAVGGMDESRRILFGINYFSGEVELIDLDDGRSVEKFQVGRRVRQAIVEPITGRIFTSSMAGIMELHPDFKRFIR